MSDQDNQEASKTAKILVVEDDQTLNDAYVTILSSAAHDVRSVYNGQEALDTLATFEPDVILLDLRMPTMSGLEFLKEAKLPETHPHAKVVVFSNYDVQRDIDESFSYGAHKYVLKSWASPKELLRLIDEVLTS